MLISKLKGEGLTRGKQHAIVSILRIGIPTATLYIIKERLGRFYNSTIPIRMFL